MKSLHVIKKPYIPKRQNIFLFFYSPNNFQRISLETWLVTRIKKYLEKRKIDFKLPIDILARKVIFSANFTLIQQLQKITVKLSFEQFYLKLLLSKDTNFKSSITILFFFKDSKDLDILSQIII